MIYIINTLYSLSLSGLSIPRLDSPSAYPPSLRDLVNMTSVRVRKGMVLINLVKEREEIVSP
jgi:hypothetical protein